MTRKKRALAFIRKKNNFRKGLRKIGVYQTISTAMSQKGLYLVNQELKKEIVLKTKRDFNIDLEERTDVDYSYRIGNTSEDIQRNTATALLEVMLTKK